MADVQDLIKGSKWVVEKDDTFFFVFNVAVIAILLSVGFCFAENENEVENVYYTTNDKSRFAWGMETGFSFGVGEYGISDCILPIFSFGAAINRHFSIALGSGAPNLVTYAKTNGIKYGDGGDDNVYDERDIIEIILENKKLPKGDVLYIRTAAVIPIFLKPRFQLSENYFVRTFFDTDIGLRTFFDTDIGLAICFTDYEYRYKGNMVRRVNYSSFYFNPSVGVGLNLSKSRLFTVSFGYKLWTAQYEVLLPETFEKAERYYETRGMVKRPNSAISLKFGFGSL